MCRLGSHAGHRLVSDAAGFEISIHVDLFLLHAARVLAAHGNSDESDVAATELTSGVARLAAIEAVAFDELLESDFGASFCVTEAVTTVCADGRVALWTATDARLAAIELAAAEDVARGVGVVAAGRTPLQLQDTADWASHQAWTDRAGLVWGLPLFVPASVVFSPGSLVWWLRLLGIGRLAIEARRLVEAAAEAHDGLANPRSSASWTSGLEYARLLRAGK